MGWVWNLLTIFFLAQIFAPKVTALEDTKVLLTDWRFQLQCVGEGQLSWRFHPDHLIQNFKELQPETKNDSQQYRGRALLMQNPQILILDIFSSQIDDTGTYECLEDGKIQTTLHLFVHDEDLCVHNFVPAPVSNVIVSYGETFVIPCRTTRPNIPVILLGPEDEEIESNYDPMKGFTIENASLKHQGLWTCEVEPSHECAGRPENYQQFIVPWFDFYEVDPEILEKSPHKVSSGDLVSIQCSAKSFSAAKLVWIGPTGDVISSSGRFSVQEIIKKGARDVDANEEISVLNINNATVADSGNYTCTVIGQRQGSDSIILDVTAKDKSLITEMKRQSRQSRSKSKIHNTC